MEVRYVEVDGSRIKTVEENHTRFVSDKKEIEAVIAYIARTAEAAGAGRGANEEKLGADISQRFGVGKAL